MKIKKEDYDILKSFIEKVFEDHDLHNLIEDYKENRLYPKRLRWDALYESKIKIGDGVGIEGDINVYAYANDDHIDTALRKVMIELGIEWASR